jgi:hypothetical protein
MWVCAYRVLCAAVDEVELDEDQAVRKVRSIFECVVSVLRFSDASLAAQSTRASSPTRCSAPLHTWRLLRRGEEVIG